MDIRLAFATARAWNRGGVYSVLGVFVDQGCVVNENHRTRLIAAASEELKYAKQATKTKDVDSKGNKYTEKDVEDLLELLKVIKTVEAGYELMPPFNEIKKEDMKQVISSWKEKLCQCSECVEARLANEKAANEAEAEAEADEDGN